VCRAAVWIATSQLRALAAGHRSDQNDRSCEPRVVLLQLYEAVSKSGVRERRAGSTLRVRGVYYGCFLRDPDGHKIEAAFWDMELAKKIGMA
jgi:hypothetical protein